MHFFFVDLNVSENNIPKLLSVVIEKQPMLSATAAPVTLSFGDAIKAETIGGYIDAQGTEFSVAPGATSLLLATSIKEVANKGNFLCEQNRRNVKDLAAAMIYLP